MAVIRERVQRILAKVKQDEITSARTRLQRRKKLYGLIGRYLPAVRALLYIVGFTWILFLPSTLLGRGIYIDENALSPGQAETYWGWAEVHDADNFLKEVEALRNRNASSEERAEYLLEEFQKMGIPSEIQEYAFEVKPRRLGSNVYAIISSPRSSGTEAAVLSAPWLSHSGTSVVNVRGVAMLLALARFLKRRSMWAKDLIFVISDGDMEGMHAFLSAYHGSHQSNLRTSQINITSGSIWTAFNIDYPGHSFAQLGLFHEGLNGRLPNQDIMNSFTYISEWNGAPVTMYDTPTKEEPFTSFQKLLLPEFLRKDARVQEYLRRARNILRHGSYQTLGKASGVHGLFHQYRIDAFTMYAIPDVGPHGFYTFGRVVESTLRSANNLLERLHASFFFYIQTTSKTFLKVGHYLPAVIAVSVATMFGGLELWVRAGWVEVPLEAPQEGEGRKEKAAEAEKSEPEPEPDAAGPKAEPTITRTKWIKRDRPVLGVLGRMALSHLTGYALWYTNDLKSRFPVFSTIAMSLVMATSSTAPLNPSAPNQVQEHEQRPKPIYWLTLKSLTLTLASTLLSISTLLNFSLSVFAAFALLPLLFVRPSPLWPGLLFGADIASRILSALGSSTQWQLYGVWVEPVFYLIYVPLMINGAMVCSLPDGR